MSVEQLAGGRSRMLRDAMVDLSQPLDAAKPYPHAYPRFRSEKLPGHAEVPLLHMYHLHIHQGTHIDAPCHFIPGGQTIDQVDLTRFVTIASVVHLECQRLTPITAAGINANLRHWEPGHGLLLHTGWGRHWENEDLYFEHPYLTEDALDRIVELKPSILGLDVVTPEKPFSLRAEGYSSPAHKAIMGNDILIVENLNLEPLKDVSEAAFFALPPKWLGADGGQIRAVAVPGLQVE